jgi:hypothetical protein
MSLKEPLLNHVDPADVDVDFDDVVVPVGVASERSEPTHAKLKSVEKPSKTFKDYIRGLSKNQLHCFETRNGVNRFGGLEIGVHPSSLRLFDYYLNYLYKFDKDGISFFITFRKQFKRDHRDDVFGSYDITL